MIDPLFPEFEEVPVSKPLENFINSNFMNCLSQDSHKSLLKDYPVYNLPVLKTPVTDKDVIAVLGRNYPSREDKSLRGIQSAILNAAIPTINLLSDLTSQGFTRKPDKLISAQEVMKISCRQLALIGNAACLTSDKRRASIIASIRPKRPKLANLSRGGMQGEAKGTFHGTFWTLR